MVKCNCLIPSLLMLVYIDPEIVNHEGHTSIEVKGISTSAIDTIRHKRSFIQVYLKIFVVGNSGNGKSTSHYRGIWMVEVYSSFKNEVCQPQ